MSSLRYAGRSLAALERKERWVGLLRSQLAAHEIKAPLLEGEYRFLRERRFRFDFAIPSLRIGIEVEGGIFIRGRHNRPKGYENDCRKYSLAAIEGWTVLRFTPPMIVRGEAIALAMDAIRKRRAVSA